MSDLAEPGRPPKLVLIDGSGFIFRAYHALPPLSRSDGTPVNAVLGFSNMLHKLLGDAALTFGQPTHMAVVFDTARKSFRNDLYADYKAHRPPPPEDLIPQFDIIREATDAFNVPRIELPGFEADDIIATYADRAADQGWDVVVVSSDKDLMQLVSDRVCMWDAMKNRTIWQDGVMEKFGVGPDKVVDVQALCGDSSDNVPGVPGIGIKTAAQLIQEYGDLDALLARASEIKQPKRRQALIDHADMARLSRDLVFLKRDVDVPLGLDDLSLRARDYPQVLTFLGAQNFKSLVVKLQAESGAAPDTDLGPTVPAAPTKTTYELVTTAPQLQDWIRRAFDVGHVAVDTETTGLDVMTADLVGVSLCVDAGHACYIPLRYSGGAGGDMGDLMAAAEAPDMIPLDQAISLLKPLLEDSSVLKIGQNIKYDLSILAKHDIHVAPVDDTMLLSYALDAGLHSHGMDALSVEHLGITPVAFKDVAGSGKSQLTFDQVPLDQARDYAAEDADLTLRLWQTLKPRLTEAGVTTLYEAIERPLIPVIAQMEREGIAVDRSMLERLSNDFATEAAALEQEIYGLAGKTFTIGSPKQLGVLLFEDLGLPGGKKNKSGGYKTDVDVLESLRHDHPLPGKVLDWRSLTKLKSTYTDALQKQINSKTGRVHTAYGMAIAQTGRLSSTDPNLQNIPIRTPAGRKIRQAFVPTDGHVLMSADYSQIELRILAHIADITALKDAFRDGVDIHALTASQVFNVPVDGMDPMVRRNAKAINFGIIYGQSAFGLAAQLGIPQRDAKTYIEAYFQQYPGIRDYMDRTKRACKTHGFVETIYGRKIHIPAINDRNGARKAFGERAAINAPIQGSAADVIKRAMIRMPDALKQEGLKAKMLLQVHDELVFEVPRDETEQAKQVIQKVMEQAASISVPLDVDVGVGDNWDEAH